jgi:hypothetical protein
MKRLKLRSERVDLILSVSLGLAFSLLFDVLPFGVAMGLFGVIVLARVFTDRRAKARSEQVPNEETAMCGHESFDGESR